MILVALAAAALAFFLSAAAGFGGSLVLVPILALLLGPKEGVALSALLLAGNNVAKIIVYRHTLPFRAALLVMLLTVVGAALGARLLLAAPERWVQIACIGVLLLSFLSENPFRAGEEPKRTPRWLAPILAFFAGATSGFSGTSGPLKGVSLRALHLDRRQLVGAASLVSLAGDLTKTVVFAKASLLDTEGWTVALAAVPLMPLAALAGSRVNARLGERAYTALFWVVMTGYAARLVLSKS
ncbi:sulfite exporter TauE/SafE family protein [Hyalangium sp.]|uniref:sulfite exporter TauE/SafE family protein n=1 Tax=Hyalangium sp. TaxID=2028555 RepID=UPI002D5617DA|nr:sulfite exporter TauE/SafE family protein [Hyalangium sp.]HYH99099.1 sulfite exporter TauE/SafE family protein [Hyalangium sp.]